MRKNGYELFGYLDDYILVAEHADIHAAFYFLYELILELGLMINPKKLTPPSKVTNCLGIVFNLVDFSLSISEEKIASIKDTVSEVMTKKSLTRTQFQSLNGKLLYIHRCVRPARIFINRILALFRKNHQKRRIVLEDGFLLIYSGLPVF